MDKSKGYIKLWRSIQQNDLYANTTFSEGQAWIDLLLSASHKRSTFKVNRIWVTIQPGQIGLGIRTLSDRWKWGINRVQTFLHVLEDQGMIKLGKWNAKTKKVDFGIDTDTPKTNVCNIISICNWADYQYCDTPSDTPSDTYQECKRNNNNISSSLRSEDLSSNEDDYSEVVSKNQKEKIDCKKFVEFWNKTMEGTRVPKIQILADQRKETLKARMSTYGKKAIFAVVEKVASSDFLSGRKTDFKASFNWVFGPKNFPKVLDGNYDNDKNSFSNGNNTSNSAEVARAKRDKEAADLVASLLAEDDAARRNK